MARVSTGWLVKVTEALCATEELAADVLDAGGLSVELDDEVADEGLLLEAKDELETTPGTSSPAPRGATYGLVASTPGIRGL